MKVVQTPARFHPYIGGVEKYVLDISKELVNNNINVKVICANEPPSDLTEYENIKIKRLPYFSKVANTNLTLTFPAVLVKEKYDIMHAHLPTPWSADWSIFLSKIKSRPTVLTYHNDITGKGIAKIIANLYNYICLPILLKLTNKIIITQKAYFQYSPFLKKYINKIEVIPISINLDNFKKIELAKIPNCIFFLSVLDDFHKYKGLNYLLEAVKEAKEKIPDIKLIIGGKGNLTEYYKKIAINLQISDNVEFVGYIPDNKLIDYYNKCQAFVLPSTDSSQEGFGIVLLEALACGTPVITTDIVGIAKEIKNESCGFVIAPKNILELKESIIKILDNDRLRNEMSTNAKNLTRNHDLKINIKKIINLYNDLLNTK